LSGRGKETFLFLFLLRRLVAFLALSFLDGKNTLAFGTAASVTARMNVGDF